VDLFVTDDGEGTPVVLLHGLTATHRYVVMGSKALERSGHRVIAYDARGHGQSDPAPDPEAYRYADLRDDLVRVMDERGIERAVLAGASMGAHTLLRLALEQPERAAALVVITPAYDPDEFGDPDSLARWDALSEGLRTGGVEGFVEAYGDPGVPENWRETVFRVIRQRLAAHEHPEALADALRATPRSRPFPSIDSLTAIEVPTVVVADRDEADPGHPLAIGEAYAEAIPNAELLVEEEGKSPLAWQGSQLSKVIADVAERADV
jgi:pimeloyl-ACP methyl ester carboxylesterase